MITAQSSARARGLSVHRSIKGFSHKTTIQTSSLFILILHSLEWIAT